MRIVDLTLPMDKAASSLPGHPVLELIPIHQHEKHGRSNTGIRVTLHAGTHVDSPYHFHKDKPSIEKVPLASVVGLAALLDIRKYTQPKVAFTADNLQRAADSLGGSLKGRIAVLYSGWAARAFYSPVYYRENPYLIKESATWLVEQGVTAVCVDFPPDKAEPGGPKPGDSPAHRTLLGAHIPLIEHVINHDKLESPKFLLVAAPIPVVGADGAPARVLALFDVDH